MRTIAVVGITLACACRVAAQLTSIVPDFAVSSLTGKPVYRPGLTVHTTTGAFAISWADERYGTSSAGRLAGIGDIFAAVYSSNGQPASNNFKVGDIKFGFFSDFSLYDSSPLLLPGGNLVVSYHVDARATIESVKFDDVYYSAYTPAGSAITLDTQLNMVGTTGSGYAYMPQAALFGSDFLIVYRYYFNDAYQIGGTLVSGSTGSRLSDAFAINDATAGGRTRPHVASNGTQTIVVWTDGRADTNGDIYLQRYSGATASGANAKVNDDASGSVNELARVAMNGAGSAVVVWIDTRSNAGGDLYAQRYNSSGAAVGANFKLTNSNSAFLEYPPAVALDDAGNFVVVWTDSLPGQQWSVKTRAYSSSNTPLTGVLEVTSPASASIQGDVKIGPDGRIYYAWLDGRTDINNGRIYAKIASLTGITSVHKDETPGTFSLSQNYPNPFNPSTTLAYDLPIPAQVSLRVYDVLGRELHELVGTQQEPGHHQVTFDAAGLSSGIYVYRLTAGPYTAAGKMLLTR